MNLKLLAPLLLFISLVFLSIHASTDEPHPVPNTNLTREEQLEELKEMSDGKLQL
jgi:hypothetical protein